MNFRKLLTYLTMGTAAAMPIATAQNPTILQGNYISNVFGNSNFVLNPNAQTNVANVTVSSATVTRSTTTPLVATSEFNITTSTSTGYADWSLRAFDQGMKNNNCEARFTYRGFSVGSTTAQILQGTNVVAQLTLTASTDPRIASINFPCGDLSAVTKFRLQQATASLTGTNEIGGIYVGLATNMANVAQAEFIGSLEWPANGASDTRAGTTWQAFQTIGAVNPTVTGNVTSPNRAPRVTIPSLKAGNYRITYTGSFAVFDNTNIDAQCSFRLTDGAATPTVYGTAQTLRSYGAINGNQGVWTPVLQFDFQYTGATQSVTLQLETISTFANTNCRVETYTNSGMRISVYRFPSSSELVVTPERQNVWGAVKWAGNADFARTTAVTKGIVNTTNFGTVTPHGKATVASTTCSLSTNDVGMCLQNVPPGTYEITTNLQLGSVYNSGTFGADLCNGFIEVAGTTLSATNTGAAFATALVSGQEDWTTIASGIVKIDSFQSNVSVVLKLTKNGALGACVVRSQASSGGLPTLPTITFKPLDQPSNSALYVQGPIKAAETGAAISAGSLGEQITCTFSSLTITTSITDLCTNTVTPGVYLVTLEADAAIGSATRLLGFYGNSSGTATVIFPSSTTSHEWSRAVDTGSVQFMGTTYARVTTGGTITLRAQAFTANVTGTRGRIQFIRLN